MGCYGLMMEVTKVQWGSRGDRSVEILCLARRPRRLNELAGSQPGECGVSTTLEGPP